jgi:hypothetical protein
MKNFILLAASLVSSISALGATQCETFSLNNKSFRVPFQLETTPGPGVASFRLSNEIRVENVPFHELSVTKNNKEMIFQEDKGNKNNKNYEYRNITVRFHPTGLYVTMEAQTSGTSIRILGTCTY